MISMIFHAFLISIDSMTLPSALQQQRALQEIAGDLTFIEWLAAAAELQHGTLLNLLHQWQ